MLPCGGMRELALIQKRLLSFALTLAFVIAAHGLALRSNLEMFTHIIDHHKSEKPSHEHVSNALKHKHHGDETLTHAPSQQNKNPSEQSDHSNHHHHLQFLGDTYGFPALPSFIAKSTRKSAPTIAYRNRLYPSDVVSRLFRPPQGQS